MNVSCPECNSVFRVDPAKVPSAGVRARCAVCGGVIVVGAAAPIEEDFAEPSTPVAVVASFAAPVPPPTRAAWPPPTSAATPAPAPTPAATHPVAGAPATAATPAAALPFPTPIQRPLTPAARATPQAPPAAPPARPVVFTPPAMGRGSATPPASSAPARPVYPPFAGPSTAPRTPPSGRPSGALPIPPAVSPGPARPAVRPAQSTPHRPATPIAPAPAVAPPPVRPATPIAAAPIAAAPSVTATPAGTAGSGAAPAPAPAPTPITPSRAPINPFLANDPNAKARRLARALVSDLVTYFPQRRDEGLRDGTLRELFRDEIKKSQEEYVEQVGRDFAETTTHFQDALNEILAGGQRLF